MYRWFIDTFSSSFVLSLSTCLSLFGFVFSLYAAIKTYKIDNKLIKYKKSQSFLKEKDSIVKRLEGYIDVINNDDFTSNLIPDLIKTLSAIKNGYNSILPLNAKWKLKYLLRYLEKPYKNINFQKMINKLAYLMGILDSGGFIDE